jgi:hypothetical protein
MMVQRVHEILDGAGVDAGKHGRGTTGMVERIEMLIKTHNALSLLLNDAMVVLMLARRNPAMSSDEAWQRRVDELRQVHEAISRGEGEPILGYDVVLEMMHDAEAENEQLREIVQDMADINAIETMGHWRHCSICNEWDTHREWCPWKKAREFLGLSINDSGVNNDH